MRVEQISITVRVTKAERQALEVGWKKGQSPVPIPKEYKYPDLQEGGNAPDGEIVHVIFKRVEQTDEKGKPV